MVRLCVTLCKKELMGRAPSAPEVRAQLHMTVIVDQVELGTINPKKGFRNIFELNPPANLEIRVNNAKHHNTTIQRV